MTKLEEALKKMTPEQRKKAVKQISNQMGMPKAKKRKTGRK